MPNIRYTSQFTNLDGDQYRIEIIDLLYDGLSTDFDCGAEGFSINWEGNNQDRWNPIISSNCTVEMKINGDDETFIIDLLNTESSRFFIKISEYISSAWSMRFVGEIANDVLEVEDLFYPYVIELTAFDGLNALKNIDYDAKAGAFETVLTYLRNILAELSIYDFLGTTIIRTAIQWYDDKMHTGTPGNSLDPVNVSRINNDAFRYENNFNTVVSRSCWDVLEKLCFAFGARCFFENGIFYFVNWNERSHQIRYRSYTAGSYITNTLEAISINTPNRVDGVFSFMPVIKEAKVTYQHKQSVYLNNLLPIQNNYAALINIGTMQGGSGEQFIFSGNIEVSIQHNGISEPVIGFPHYWVFLLRIQVGTYYLTNVNGYLQWSTNSAHRYRVQSLQFVIEGQGYYENIPIGFITPPLPASDTAYFQLTFDDIYKINGDPLTLPTGYSDAYTCQDFNLRLNIQGSLDAGSILFYNDNPDATSMSNRTNVELPDTFIGDGPHAYSVGRVVVYNATTTSWENASGDWRINGAGDAFEIINLLLDEVIRGQKKPIRVFRGNIFGHGLNFRNQITFGGFRYLCRAANYEAYTNRWTGEWVQQRITSGSGGGGGGGIGIEVPPINKNSIFRQLAQTTQQISDKSAANVSPVKKFVQSETTTTTATTETNLIGSSGAGSNNFEANSLVDGQTIKISAKGRVSNAGATPVDPNEVTIKLYWDSTQIATTTLQIGDGETNNSFNIQCDIAIRTTGATGTAIAAGYAMLQDVAGSMNIGGINSGGTFSIDTTQANQIEIKSSWWQADTGIAVNMDIVTIEIV